MYFAETHSTADTVPAHNYCFLRVESRLGGREVLAHARLRHAPLLNGGSVRNIAA